MSLSVEQARYSLITASIPGGKVMEWVFAIGDEFDLPNGEHRKVTGVGVRRISDEHYELIAGERRWRAARRAGLDNVLTEYVLTEGGPLPFYWVRKYATNLRRAK